MYNEKRTTGDKRKFLIDCDTGTDDAIAIIAALYAKEIDVQAITTVTGNVSVKYTSENTLNLTRYLGSDIPVSVGAWGPLKLHSEMCYAEETHGKAGLGTVQLPKSADRFDREKAPAMIYRKAAEAEGQLEILAIGPLTNIAIALLLYPSLKKSIKHLWVMGGAVYGGNVTPTAEFNFWCDPEAARLVLKSGIPCTLVGLDVTTKAVLTKDDIKGMKALGTRAGKVVADILEFMAKRHEAGGEDLLMHDALALAAALCPSCLKCKDYYVDVECEGAYTYGHAEVDVWGETGKQANASVAVDINVPQFRKWLYEAIAESKE